MRGALAKVIGRAARAPLGLAVLGGAVIGAALLASWPIAALGGAAYAALVASDVTSAEFRRKVLVGRAQVARLPAAREIVDADVRRAVDRVREARAELDAVAKATPERVRRHVRTALAAVDELEAHAAMLAQRADELSRYLPTDLAAANADADALAKQAEGARDPAARADYRAAAAEARERHRALGEVAAARERTLAHLARIASAIKGVPAKLVRLRALDDAASDALTGDVGGELERMNVDLRVFEQTLEAIAEPQKELES